VRHVLPALRKRSPHLAEKFLCGIESSSQLAGMLCVTITSTPVSQSQRKQQGQGLGAGLWQQLLLSPHLLNQSINQCYTCSYEAQKAHASHSLISRR
jgi:hypothetical protein